MLSLVLVVACGCFVWSRYLFVCLFDIVSYCVFDVFVPFYLDLPPYTGFSTSTNWGDSSTARFHPINMFSHIGTLSQQTTYIIGGTKSNTGIDQATNTVYYKTQSTGAVWQTRTVTIRRSGGAVAFSYMPTTTTVKHAIIGGSNGTAIVDTVSIFDGSKQNTFLNQYNYSWSVLMFVFHMLCAWFSFLICLVVTHQCVFRSFLFSSFLLLLFSFNDSCCRWRFISIWSSFVSRGYIDPIEILFNWWTICRSVNQSTHTHIQKRNTNIQLVKQSISQSNS